jgi:DNA-binding IclR family transcriptional regulator
VPVLRDLAQETGEHAVLSVRYRGDTQISVEGVQGEHALQARSHVGEPFPLHIGAASKFLLAAMPGDERSALLDRMEYRPYNERTIRSRAALEAEIELALQQGYYAAEEDWETGLNAVSAPVRDETGQTVACISVFVPTARFSDAHRAGVVDAVLKSANRLSRVLGHAGRGASPK